MDNRRCSNASNNCGTIEGLRNVVVDDFTTENVLVYQPLTGIWEDKPYTTSLHEVEETTNPHGIAALESEYSSITQTYTPGGPGAADTFTLTFATPFDCYIRGKKFKDQTGGWSVNINKHLGAVEGFFCICLRDVAGVLTISFENIPQTNDTVTLEQQRNSIILCQMYFSSSFLGGSNSPLILLGTYHTTSMSVGSRISHFYQLGCSMSNGGALTDFVLGDGSLLDHCQFGVEAMSIIRWEHLGYSNLIAKDTPKRIFYFEYSPLAGTDLLRSVTDANGVPIILSGGVPQYNTIGVGTSGLVPVLSGDFFFVFVFASLQLNHTAEVIYVLGQNEYANLSAARTSAITAIDGLQIGLSSARTLAPLGIVIFRYLSTYTNAYKCRIRPSIVSGVTEDYVDLRRFLPQKPPQYTIIEAHDELSGLGDDDHSQYVLSASDRVTPNWYNNNIKLGGLLSTSGHSFSTQTSSVGKVWLESDILSTAAAGNTAYLKLTTKTNTIGGGISLNNTTDDITITNAHTSGTKPITIQGASLTGGGVAGIEPTYSSLDPYATFDNEKVTLTRDKYVFGSTTAATDNYTTIHSKQTCYFHIEADTDNITETQNPILHLSQDGQRTGAMLYLSDVNNVIFGNTYSDLDPVPTANGLFFYNHIKFTRSGTIGTMPGLPDKTTSVLQISIKTTTNDVVKIHTNLSLSNDYLVDQIVNAIPSGSNETKNLITEYAVTNPTVSSFNTIFTGSAITNTPNMNFVIARKGMTSLIEIPSFSIESNGTAQATRVATASTACPSAFRPYRTLNTDLNVTYTISDVKQEINFLAQIQFSSAGILLITITHHVIASGSGIYTLQAKTITYML